MHTIKGCLVKYFVPWFDGTVIKPLVFTNQDEKKSIPLFSSSYSLSSSDASIGSLDLEFKEDGIYYTGIIFNGEHEKYILRDIAMINSRPGLFAKCVKKKGKDIVDAKIIRADFSAKCDNAAYLMSIDGTDVETWRKKQQKELEDDSVSHREKEYIITINDGKITNAKELVRCKNCVYWVERYTPTCDFCTLDGVGRGAGYFCYGGIMKGAENHE